MDISEELTQKSQMEAILGPDSEEPFETFMSDLMEKRSTAESMLNTMKHKDPNSLALKLAEFLGSSHYIESREKYAVLLKKLLAEDDLAAFLYQCITASSNSNKLKRSAFLIFSQLAKDIGEIVVPGVKDLRSFFRNTLNDDTVDCDVRIAATKAVISFIQCISSSNEKEIFQELLPGVMGTLTDAISRSSGKAKEVLKLLIELAENDPRFLRTQLVDVVGSMFEIAEDESLEEETRHLAIEFLLTLVEAKKRAPGMMKRVPLFISRCFAVLLRLLVDVSNKDDPAWHSAPLADPLLEQSGTSRNCMRCLIRFSVALGGKSIVHIAKEQLLSYLAAPEWEKRHAALIALLCIANGCSEVIRKKPEQVLSMVLNCFHDPHPRVRWAACCVIGMMSVALYPDLQEQCHNKVFPALAAALDDFQNPLVQACCMEALCHFCLPSEPEYLMPYLDDIVSKLLVLIQGDKQMLQQQALTALGYVADSVKEHLTIYYDRIMQQLKIVLRNADLKSNLVLQAATMECISGVWSAVGMEKFKEDTKQVMGMLMSLGGLQMKTDDSTASRMLIACGRFCECMKKEFLPYMRVIFPFFIQCAQLEPVMTISGSDYDNYEFGENRTERKANLQEKNRVLKIKSNACKHLCLSIEVLKEEFYQWIPQAVSVFVPLLKFYTYNEVREYAVRAMALLLQSAKLAVKKGIAQGGSESYFTKLSANIMKSMVEALHEECETEVCAIILEELYNCLQICGPSLFTEGQVSSIVNELKHVIIKSSSRKQELVKRAKMEDFDAEEAELLREEREQEDEIYENVGEILCVLINEFKGAFLPFLDEWSSYLLPMWAKEKTTSERGTSMAIFVELLGEWPGPALKYYEEYLPLILDASNDEVPYIRRIALHALGLWMEYDSFIPFVGAALSRINVVITHINALEPENVDAYVKAVSALGKICTYHGKSIDLAQVIPAWLNCLPIKVDSDDSDSDYSDSDDSDSDDYELTHGQLCLMVERYHRELLGPNYQYLPKVISIFAEVLCSKEDEGSEEDEEIIVRTIDVLRHLQKILPPNTLESACSYILPQHEMVLKSYLSLDEDADF